MKQNESVHAVEMLEKKQDVKSVGVTPFMHNMRNNPQTVNFDESEAGYFARAKGGVADMHDHAT
jgi:hypothetical protein